MDTSKLKRSINTNELLLLNSFFALGRGYKDLIRDMNKTFNVKMTKKEAKHFMESRSWCELLEWLTGEHIDTGDMDKIPQLEKQYYDSLFKMIEASKEQVAELQPLIDELDTLKNNNKLYLPHDVEYINMPMYGEIITYKRKEPFLKCFLLNEKGKIEKVEDVPITDERPELLLHILKAINTTYVEILDDVDITRALSPYLVGTRGLEPLFVRTAF